MERRNSHDDRTPRQSVNPNVFDDEYAVDPTEDDYIPGVADGFRPRNEAQGGDGGDHNREQSPRRSIPATKLAEADLRRMASRNSTLKTAGVRESISHDGRHPGTHTRGPSSQATALQHRASISSTGSFATMARSESPYGVGPSHPYGMYPQNTMARPSSVATASTQPQTHRSVSLQRPTHPYGMYPQNVMETSDETPMAPTPPPIPVGFPGLNTGYHRQIGPDGEEQDIIGPDGHTEQLPPYSRYPEEGPTKEALAAEASASATSTPVEAPIVPLNASDDTLLPSANRHSQHQEEQPSEDGDLPSSSTQSTPSRTQITSSNALSATEEGVAEKQKTKKGWKGWTSKRLWGKVPLGVVLVLLVLVLIFAIILGAAIGTFVAKGKSKHDNNDKPPNNNGDTDDVSPQVTPTGSLFDASPIPTPLSLPPLPTGAYALPLGIAQESSPSCLTMANQLSAWSCKMTFVPLLLKVNNSSPKGRPNPVASIEPFTKPDGSIQYGVQPPTLSVQSLQLVLDQDYTAYGPAYHFQGMYDKIVILSYDEFTAGASLRKRDTGAQDDDSSVGDNPNGDEPEPKPNNFRHQFQVRPGDMPWYCIWNETFIEGYIYAKENSTAATLTAFPSAWPSSNAFGSSILIEPTLSSADIPPSTTPAGEPPAPTSSFQRRGDGDLPLLPAYPRIVKIEERRLPGSPQPYCQKMRLLEDGTLIEEENDGAPIRFMLQEDSPNIEEFLLAANGPPPNPSQSSNSSTSSPSAQRRALDKRRDPAGACHCQWMFQ